MSYGGYRYYLIFIDDDSRYTWLFPLVNKSETFNYFCKFKNAIEKQFGADIELLQSDGGSEYVDKTFASFLQNHGIQYRISCPHTLQQNDVEERKHRHIVEIGLSLLHQAVMAR